MDVSKLTCTLEIFNSSVIVFNNGLILVTEGLKLSDTKKIVKHISRSLTTGKPNIRKVLVLRKIKIFILANFILSAFISFYS